MGEEYRERRKFPRFPVPGKVEGTFSADYRITVVNLSRGGALVEHPASIPVGSISQLTIPTGKGEIRVLCRVVRSLPARQEIRGGEEVLIYQTGLEFLSPSPDTLTAVEDLIGGGQRGGGTG